MLKNRFLLANITISIIIIQAMLWALILTRNNLPPELPLWYLKPWGGTQLAPLESLWLVPGSTAAILLVNILLANFFYRRERLLAQLLIVFSSLSSMLGGIALGQILRLFL